MWPAHGTEENRPDGRRAWLGRAHGSRSASGRSARRICVHAGRSWLLAGTRSAARRRGVAQSLTWCETGARYGIVEADSSSNVIAIDLGERTARATALEPDARAQQRGEAERC